MESRFKGRALMRAKALCVAGLVLGLSATLLAYGLAGGQQVSSPPADAVATMSVAAQNALVQQYCVGCHDDAQKTGGLSLEAFDAAHPDSTVVAMMVGKLRAGAMPPKNMPRPDAGTLYTFITALAGEGSAVPVASHAAPAAAPTAAPAVFAPQVIAFPHAGDSMTVEAQNTMVHTICIQCHTDKRKPGGLSFEHFDMAQAPAHAKIAEDMLAKLRAGMMPPQTAPKRPDEASIHAFVVSLENRVDRQAALHPDPGSRLFQRLNRVEYANSISAMLGLNVDVSQWLPPDTMSHNFDNIADVQGVSPTLLQAYLDAADQISRLAVGDIGATPASVSYETDNFASQMNRVPGAPMGTRGGLSVVHIFPADGQVPASSSCCSIRRSARCSA